MPDDLITTAYSIPDVLIPEFVLWIIRDQHHDADTAAQQKWAESWTTERERIRKAAALLHQPDDFATLAIFPAVGHQRLSFLQNSLQRYTLPFWSDYWRALSIMGTIDPHYPVLVDCEIVSPDGGEVQYQDQGPGLVPLPIGTLTVTLRLRWSFLLARHYYGHLREAIPQHWPQAKLTRPMPLREEPEIAAPQKPKTAPIPNARNQDSIWQEWFDYYHDMSDVGYGTTWVDITKAINELGRDYSDKTVRGAHSTLCKRCKYSNN